MVKALFSRRAKQPTAAGRFALNALSLIAVNLFMRTVGVAILATGPNASFMQSSGSSLFHR